MTLYGYIKCIHVMCMYTNIQKKKILGVIAIQL